MNTGSDRVPVSVPVGDVMLDSRFTEGSQQRWEQAFDHHCLAFSGLHRPEVCRRARFDGCRPFQGHLRSGHLGSLRFLRSWVSHGDWELLNLPGDRGGRHELMLVVSGRVSFRTTHRSLTAEAGHFVLVGNTDRLHVGFDAPSECILLRSPFGSHDVRDHLDAEVVTCALQADSAALLSHWLRYACDRRAWLSGEVGASAAQVLRGLLSAAMQERLTRVPRALSRDVIEAFILHNLEDPSLSVAAIAKRLACSVRTLHRVFRREGDESLERYIQRQRIEACAAVLRQSTDEVPTLTALAMRFGFASSSHFCTAFRSQFGVPPSSYRQRFTAVA